MIIEPFLKSFNDYHFIDEALEYYQDINPTIHGEELGFDGYNYIGLYYIGTRPSKDKIKQLLEEANITLRE